MSFRSFLFVLIILTSPFRVAHAADDLVIGSTSFSFLRSDNSLELTVKNAKLGQAPSVQTTVLDNPARLVIDISPPLSSLNGRYRLTDALCQTLRLGTDSTRTRIVVDCGNLPRGQFQSERKAGEIKVRFSSSLSVSTSTTLTTVTTTTLPAVPGKITLQKLSFEKGVALLRFSERTDYSLLKGPSGTVLSFPNTVLAGQHLALEHFPPGNVHGILAVIPTKGEAGVSVKFLMDTGYELKAEWQGEALVITPAR